MHTITFDTGEGPQTAVLDEEDFQEWTRYRELADKLLASRSRSRRSAKTAPVRKAVPIRRAAPARKAGPVRQVYTYTHGFDPEDEGCD